MHRAIRWEDAAHLSWLLREASYYGVAIRSSRCSIVIVFHDYCLLPSIPPCEKDDHLPGLQTGKT